MAKSLLILPLAAIALIGATSCTVESTTRLRVPSEIEASANTPRSAAGGDGAARDGRAPAGAAPRIETFSNRVVAEVQPRGTIPYDNMTLPLVSADGRFLATQTGFAPAWASIVAEPGAAPPDTTRIEIYELPLTGNDPPVLRTVVNEVTLLGRSCDPDGFIVESPRPDGSRWIGRADWTTGRVKWLVAEPGTVAAFATLADGGRLAYSSRPVDGGEFDLVVRQDGEEHRLVGNGGDWLFPTWGESAASGEGDGLFALLLRGDMLDAVHMEASGAEQMRRTIQRLPLASRGANRDVAYQALSASVVCPVPPRGSGATDDRLFFFHPSRLCAAVWSPGKQPVIFDRGSFAAVADSSDPASVLVVTPGDLLRRRIDNDRNRSKLIAGTQVPRVTLAPERPYVLLRPADGAIGLTVMRLLPADAIAGGAP